MRLIFAAAAAGGDARHTVDYAARIAATDISGFDSPAFLTGLPQGVVMIGARAAANTYSFTAMARDPVLLGTTMEISSGAAVDAAKGGVLETGGGRIAAVTLAVAATALFLEDNAEVGGNVVLVDGGQRRLHEVRFASAPRAISFIDNDVFTVQAPARVPRLVADLRERLQVWHYEGETYSITVLGAVDADLFTLDGSRVSVVGDGLLPGLYTVDVEVSGVDELAGVDESISGRMIVDVPPPLFGLRSVTVPAGSSGQAIVTLTVGDGEFKSDAFSFLPFDENMFSSGGGDKAVITMNRDQASFTDNQIFTLSVIIAQAGRNIVAPVEVRSAPSFEPLAAVEGSYFIPVFIGETARGNGVAISIGFRHLFGAEPDPSHFSISGEAAEYFKLINDDLDLDLEHIRNVFFSDLPVDNGTVGMLTVSGALSYDDGGSLAGRTAREFQIAIGFAGDDNDESVAIAVDDLVSTIVWTETNAYDYTHTVSVTIDGSATMTVIDLREVGTVMLDGSSEAKAFPIFNIWQLQAIDGRQGR